MPKKRKKRNGSMKEQMEGLAIAITPITIEKKRAKKQEGGELEAQVDEPVPVEETSADEEDRDIEAQMEELEAAKSSLPAEEDMMPDEQMEDEYLDFVISQSLSPEEETALMNKLEADPELSVMFDKIMDTAIEFSGSGPVEGPGSEVSDSIPARLSDGEFVFTAKAADQIGSERLQSMMEDAEAEADDVERQEIALGGSIENKSMVNQYSRPIDGNTATEEIKKSMLSINPRLR
jgi:membrane-associated HD superfamily phosphohydrolase|tara:strand:- start:1017 stop:1721 length:705 start_codon:yes stop_codon:yes gene_type:complete